MIRTNPTNDRRTSNSEETSSQLHEETLVSDIRAEMSPSQRVEQKLIGMLKDSPLLISHVQRRLKPGPR